MVARTWEVGNCSFAPGEGCAERFCMIECPHGEARGGRTEDCGGHSCYDLRGSRYSTIPRQRVIHSDVYESPGSKGQKQ